MRGDQMIKKIKRFCFAIAINCFQSILFNWKNSLCRYAWFYEKRCTQIAPLSFHLQKTNALIPCQKQPKMKIARSCVLHSLFSHVFPDSYIHLNRSIPMILQHNEILNPIYPISSDFIPVLHWRLFLSLPLTVAIWAFDPVEMLWQAGSRGQRKREDIVLQEIHRRDMQGGTTRGLVESYKVRGVLLPVWKIYGVRCGWHCTIFLGSSLDWARWHICGREPNHLWFTPHHHLEGGLPSHPVITEDVLWGVAQHQRTIIHWDSHTDTHKHIIKDLWWVSGLMYL